MPIDLDHLAGPLDVKKWVDVSMQAERAKRLKGLEIRKKIDNLQVGAFQNLQTLLTNFQTSLTSLSTAFATVGYQVASSNPAVASATITANSVVPGSHTINVTQLAKAQSNVSTSFSNPSVSSAETLTFTNQSGASTFNVTVNVDDTLQDIANNINSADGNFGVTATVITSVDDSGNPLYTLFVNSDQTGVANGFTLTGDSELGLNSNPANIAAQDALYTFDGLNEDSPSNVIGNSDGTGGVMSGLSFTLSSLGTTTLNVTQANANQISDVNTAMQAMITAYNSIMTTIDSYQMNPNTYNNAFADIKTRIQSVLNAATTATGDVNFFSKTGMQLAPGQPQTVVITNLWKDKDAKDKDTTVTYISSGSIQMNTNSLAGPVFSNVLNNDFSSLEDFFTDKNTGFITEMNNLLNNEIVLTQTPGSNNVGLLANSLKPVQNNLKSVQSEIDYQETILKKVEEGLTLKWGRANALLAKINNQSEYLEKQFASMADMYNTRK